MALNLFSGSDSENDDISEIEINEEFARRFEHNKRREDLQRFEELKKKDVIGSPLRSEDDESDSESSDDDFEKLHDPKSDIQLFEALVLLKKNDPVIKQKDFEFFKSDDGSKDGSDDKKSESKDKKEKKPMFLKDVIAKHLIEEGADFGDKEEETYEKDKAISKTYDDVQEELKRDFLEAVEKDGVGDGEDDFLTLKENAGEEKVDSDYKEYEEKLFDEYFGGDDKSNESSRFLKNFFKNRMWINKNGDNSNVGVDDLNEISEDEMEIERQKV